MMHTGGGPKVRDCRGTSTEICEISIETLSIEICELNCGCIWKQKNKIRKKRQKKRHQNIWCVSPSCALRTKFASTTLAYRAKKQRLNEAAWMRGPCMELRHDDLEKGRFP